VGKTRFEIKNDMTFHSRRFNYRGTWTFDDPNYSHTYGVNGTTCTGVYVDGVIHGTSLTPGDTTGCFRPSRKTERLFHLQELTEELSSAGENRQSN
jgi:hypothetical protein